MGAPMARDPKCPQRYVAAERFVAVALRTDGSLFTPGQPIWSMPVLNEFARRYRGAKLQTTHDVLEVLRQVLKGADDQTVQFAAELLFVHLLMLFDFKGDKKPQHVRAILSLRSSPLALPADL